MDIFNVDAQLCWREAGRHRGRERERPQGLVWGRPLTPNAWFRQSVSCCHRELEKSCSCTGVSVSEAQRGASWLGLEP